MIGQLVQEKILQYFFFNLPQPFNLKEKGIYSLWL